MRIPKGLVLSGLVWSVAAVGGTAGASEWEPAHAGLTDTAFTAVAIDRAQPERIWAASRRRVYASSDGGRNWVARFEAPADAIINDVAIGPPDPPTLFAATTRGLYGSVDGGTRWSRVFRGSGEGEGDCTTVVFHPTQHARVALGTRGGLFVSDDAAAQWREVDLPLAEGGVIRVAVDPTQPDQLYVLGTHALFVVNLATGAWQQPLTAGHAPDDVERQEAERPAVEPEEADQPPGRFSDVAVHPQEPSTLYLAGARGVERSLDGGRTWRPLARSGLASASVSHLLVQAHSPVVIYAATDRGVARYASAADRWIAIMPGLSARVHDLEATAQQLWAATEQGLYRYDVPPDGFGDTDPPSARELLSNFSYEPTIAQVQDAAIRYAEVSPEKIARWRRQAALKALLPTVDLGLDRDSSRDIHIDEGSFPNFQVLETEDRDRSVDFTISWDLGELIWNQMQSIPAL